MEGTFLRGNAGPSPVGVAEDEEVSVFQAREKRVRVQTYVPEALKRRIESLQRAWTFIERLDNPEASEWSESDTVNRLLSTSLNTAWGELGGEPQDEAAWKRFEDDIRKARTNVQKKR